MSDDRRDYAILISLAMREEAEVVASALRADGVDAFVGDANHASMNWTYALALGGLQIFVPRQKLAEAKSLLQERIRENADRDSEERIGRRDRWKIWLFGVWVYGPLLAAWFQYFVIPEKNWIPIPDLARMIRDPIH